MAEAVPIPTINRMKKLITAVETQSSRILEEKKAALKAGNTKVVERIGEGKDIMSILRTHAATFYLVGMLMAMQ